ncbi:hypothetical protein Zmor_013005 [Zophobas morio]|uniref:Uncharacterized protein n=1 Tax=Zophobas morio TaxID=2755281 RepID=A0AA38ID08_9CUCU|nr:hypothetical protein Zmor_013005 [Zophobas morio]
MNLFLPLLLLLTANYACSFDCYFTNFDDLKTLDKNAETVIKDCEDHIVNNIGFIRRPKKPSFLWKALEDDPEIKNSMLSWNMNHRCYTLSFKAQFENTTEDVRIQLCDYKDNCEHFFGRVKGLDLLVVTNITCVECFGNLCNTKDAEEKEEVFYEETSSYRRNLSIGAGGCGVVGGIGTLIRLLCYRKSKNSKSVNV